MPTKLHLKCICGEYPRYGRVGRMEGGDWWYVACDCGINVEKKELWEAVKEFMEMVAGLK